MATVTRISGWNTWAAFLFPVVWFGIGLPQLIFGTEESWARSTMDPERAKVTAWIFVMALGAIPLYIASQLKRILLIGDELDIRGLIGRVDRLPLRDVASIEVINSLKLQHVSPVRLAIPSATRGFRSVLFLPASRNALFALREAWEQCRPAGAIAMSKDMPITGSSTWVAKLLFPVILIGFWLAVLAFGGDAIYRPNSLLGLGGMKALAWTIVIILGMASLRFGRRLRSVRLVHDQVEIGGFLEHVLVPLREVAGLERVREINFNHANPVRMTFEHPTPFLEHVLFLPGSDDALATLRAAWNEARGAVPGSTHGDEPPVHLAASLRHRPRIKLPGLPKERPGGDSGAY